MCTVMLYSQSSFLVKRVNIIYKKLLPFLFLPCDRLEIFKEKTMAGIGELPVPGNAYTPVHNPVVVVGPQFVAPYPIDLVLSKKLFKLGEGHFDITDVNGTQIFTLRNKFFSIRDRRTLLDACGSPLLTLQQKVKNLFLFSCG